MEFEASSADQVGRRADSRTALSPTSASAANLRLGARVYSRKHKLESDQGDSSPEVCGSTAAINYNFCPQCKSGKTALGGSRQLGGPIVTAAGPRNVIRRRAVGAAIDRLTWEISPGRHTNTKRRSLCVRSVALAQRTRPPRPRWANDSKKVSPNSDLEEARRGPAKRSRRPR